MEKKIEKQIKEASLLAVELYKELHQWPELGNEEYETAKKIKEELERIGIPYQTMLDTGVVGILNEEKAHKGTVAIRADMDALPITENTGSVYASKKPGLMHACGHDVHIAILLGTAKILAEMKEKINGCVKFLFQPAEENVGGAERMMEEGCLENPKVDCILGLHVKPELEAGKIEIPYGTVHASSDSFQMIVNGKKSHGAEPNRGIDAILVSANIISNLQGIVSRIISPMENAIITVGTIEGGTAENVIADEVKMKGTIRTFSKETRQKIFTSLSRFAVQTAKCYGASARVIYQPGYAALVNEDGITSKLEKIAKNELGEEKVSVLREATLGVDDFSAFLKDTPGAFFFLGCGFPGKENCGIHSEAFLVNEACIYTGIEIETSMVLQLLQPKKINEIRKGRES
ncbi:M20 family metallopeptidase [Sinanaerobacter sp. ZZT-01]|uniref:M20 metallopeptidase family protein n=1 Tax=Sinanaerobacter sp. ZZT-01 TaxID=3111540 RepID=UPI002D78C1DB|nr:M20 family metallopeptidase [Sinanaerobacter sp. ZZT-01]WRR92855.1 M20 family metallopeptidase [Sinanaerobacter sp. ZZT-01]